MGLAPENVSDEEYRQAVELATADGADVFEFLATLGIDKVSDIIARVRADRNLSSLSRDQRIALVKSLFLIGERFARDEPIGMLSVPFHWRVGYAVSDVLEGDGDEAYEVLLAAVRGVKRSIGGAISDVDLRARLFAKEGAAIPALSMARIEALKAAVVEKVTQALDDGEIQHEYYLARIAYVLDEWGIGDLVDRLAEEIRKSSDLLISYVNSLRQRGGFEGLLKRKPIFFSLQHVDRIIPPEDLTKRIEELFESGYGTEEQQNVMRDFIAQQRRPVDPDDPFEMYRAR